MNRRTASGTAITPAPAITRCSCSTSLATSNAVLCVPATCTALTAGTTCSSLSWRATRARSHASICGQTRPLQCPRSTSSWKPSGSYAIRLPANQILQHRIGYLLTRPVGRPSNEVRRFHANFTYQAGSWTKPRRVIAKVEWHPGELYPRVGFIVTNLSRPSRAGRRLLQQARDVRTMDQGRQGRDQVDTAV